MATIGQFQGRLRLAVREALQKVLADGELPEATEGDARFTTIEFEQQLAESGMGPPHCPHCGFEGQRAKQRQRTVQTRRGLEVPLSEQECYCPGCRRRLRRQLGRVAPALLRLCADPRLHSRADVCLRRGHDRPCFKRGLASVSPGG